MNDMINEYKYYNEFIKHFTVAQREGMEMEFIEWMLSDLSPSYDCFLDAIEYANREWDL